MLPQSRNGQECPFYVFDRRMGTLVVCPMGWAVARLSSDGMEAHPTTLKNCQTSITISTGQWSEPWMSGRIWTDRTAGIRRRAVRK